MATLGATNTTKNYNCLDRTVTEVEVVNSDVETTVFTYTVPGGTLSTDKMIRATIICDYLNNTGTNKEFYFVSRYGGSEIGFKNIDLSASATRRGFAIVILLTAQGATDAQFGVMQGYDLPIGLSIGIRLSAVLALDSTANQDLILQVKHEVADASLSLRLKAAFVELLELT